MASQTAAEKPGAAVVSPLFGLGHTEALVPIGYPSVPDAFGASSRLPLGRRCSARPPGQPRVLASPGKSFLDIRLWFTIRNILVASSIYPDEATGGRPLVLIHGAANSAKVRGYRQRELAPFSSPAKAPRAADCKRPYLA